MGKTYQFSDDLLRTIRRKIHKDGVTLVKNKKTGVVFLRRLTTNPTPPLTERQSLNRQNFIDRSHKASQWIKDNEPKACPPDGTLEYQKIMRSFKRQNKYKRLLYFLMAKMSIFVLLPFALSSFTANAEDSPQQDEAFDYIKDRQFKVSHFNTIDPKADQYPELNPYLYCTGNPLTYVDPTGMKVYKNAQQLYDKGMEAINNEKFQPGYNGSTHCNQAAQYINGNDESFVGLANKMGNDLRNKPDFATSISPEEAQSYANQGVTVFVSWINEEGGHGHIAVVAPGKMSYSTSAGKKVVNIFNVGADNGLMKVTDGFGNRHVEYFILNSDLETIQTYTCGELQEITVVEKANIPEYKCYVTVPQLEKPNLNELLPSIK